MDKQAVIERLRYLVDQAGSQTAFAKQHGIVVQYVNDVLHGKRNPGPQMLQALGLTRTIVYEEASHDTLNAD